MSKVNFRSFSFIETKSLNMDPFMNEDLNKFKCHRDKVFPETRKKFVINKVL